MVAMMLVTARPASTRVHPFPQRPNVDTASGQLVQRGGDFANGPSEPVYGNHHKVIAIAEPAHAFRPARSAAPGASGGGVGE
jgi:hypothetical protein